MSNLNVNTTTMSGMSPVMEAILNRYSLENNKTKRKYTQFAQQVDIPKGATKTIAFDKMSPLPKATKPLTEGVTPTGAAANITRIKAEPDQFGNYVSYSDQLDFFAKKPDGKILNYTDLLSENQLETFEHLDAMELASGTNVFYAGGAESRDELSKKLTVKDIRDAVTSLKRNKVKPANGKEFVAFIHPDMVNAIWEDEEWRQPHTYADTKQLYEGEIGSLFGVRFIEDPDAYVFRGTDLGGYPELSILKIDGDKLYIAESITNDNVGDFASKSVYINNKKYEISSAVNGHNGEAYLTMSTDMSNEPVSVDMKIYPGDGGVNGAPVYSTVIVGKNAYGSAGDKSVELINKPIGSAGTADPLNQRGSYGWKGYHFFKILEQSALVRVESL